MNKEKTNSKLLRAFLTGYSPIPITEQTFSRILKSRFPKIQSVNFPGNKGTWQGFAFADFAKKEDFLEFLKVKRSRLEEYSMNLVIKPHKTGKALKRYLKDVKKRKIEVSNIPFSWGDEKLETLFSQFGVIENCYIEKDMKFGKVNGVVFFKNRKSANICKKKRSIHIENENLTLGITPKIEEESENTPSLRENHGSIEDLRGSNVNNNPLRRRNITSQGDFHQRNSQGNRYFSNFFNQKTSNLDTFEETCFSKIVEFHQEKPSSKKYFDFRGSNLTKTYDENFGENLKYKVNRLQEKKFC